MVWFRIRRKKVVYSLVEEEKLFVFCKTGSRKCFGSLSCHVFRTWSPLFLFLGILKASCVARNPSFEGAWVFLSLFCVLFIFFLKREFLWEPFLGETRVWISQLLHFKSFKVSEAVIRGRRNPYTFLSFGFCFVFLNVPLICFACLYFRLNMRRNLGSNSLFSEIPLKQGFTVQVKHNPVKLFHIRCFQRVFRSSSTQLSTMMCLDTWHIMAAEATCGKQRGRISDGF